MPCIAREASSKAVAVRTQATRVAKAKASAKVPAAPKLVSSRDDDLDERHQRGGIQSISRAFMILEEIARAREGIPLSELSKRVGLHNSTAFHLVKTMVSLGYIRQERDTKRYRIGRPLVRACGERPRRNRDGKSRNTNP